MKRFALLIPLIISLFLTPPPLSAETSQGADLDLKIGKMIRTDVPFRDEHGKEVLLKDRLGKPTILSLNYYECKDICTPMLTGLADALDKIELEPGQDFQVWTVSIDPKETPDLAIDKKREILSSLHRPFSDESWTFFTGKPESIQALSDSVGYSFSIQGDGFIHPGALIILSTKGKIIRYIYGQRYLPLDLEMALMEASHGRVGQTVRKVLLTCFRFDPEENTYVFDATRVGGTVVLLSAAIFLIVLRSKRRPGGRNHD